MNQSVVIRCIILLVLVQQINSGVWFYFEVSSGSSSYAGDVDFTLDEVDSDYGGDSYNSFDDLDEKMERHELFGQICLWISLFILGIAITGTTTQIRNAERACFILALTSLASGCMFVTFPDVLEDDAEFFSASTGVPKNEVYFWNQYTDSNDNEYKWGPKFAWFSSTLIIPIYCFYLSFWLESIPTSNYSRNRNNKNINRNYQSSLVSAGINVPNSTFTPTTMNHVQPEFVITSAHNPSLENEEIFTEKNVSFVEKEIKFSRPKLQKKFDPIFTLTGINASYLVEGIITYSGCSEILFGTRATDGRMVVIKKPYGYRNQNEKGKNGMVNTYASARKQLENEHQFLSKMMEHNKSNFPELIDRFDVPYERRKEEYMVMKYFDPSLKKYVKFHSTKKGGLEYNKGIELFIKIAKAVNVIHEKVGYVWADLKSENILMERNNPIIIDFGTSTAPVTTRAKVKIDSGGWSAPETIKGRPVFSSDIYSLGKLLGYILTGISPKSNQKPKVFKAQMLHEIKKRNIDVNIVDVIIKCTDEKIENRYDGISALLSDIGDKSDETKTCSNCNSEINSGVLFCRHCGHSVKNQENEKKIIKIKECNSCKHKIEPNANFCLKCGNNLTKKSDDKFSPGIKIEHEIFGTGIVETSKPLEAYSLNVKFDNGKVETVSSTHVQIKSKKIKKEKSKRKKVT